ncbi:MAG: urease subunit gamma [Dysgonamonadaceae bacterium]|jgi:urease subunit gamma/beta|nr:urease subunit gamma [Dysgonamonadaceae bacterium]
MRLTPRDQEKLMLHTACTVAQKRYARGLKLNYPEAVALISGQLLELVRDGYTLAELTELGKTILGTDDVMPGVAEMIDRVQVEGTLIDGTKLVSVHRPVSRKTGNAELALYASGLTKIPLYGGKQQPDNSMNVLAGEETLLGDPVFYNEGRKTVALKVTNAGSRDIQVGSHLRFEKVNKALVFDREASVGYRLNIPAGTAVRFSAGETRTVELVGIVTSYEVR